MSGVEVAAIVVSLTCLALVTWMYMKDAAPYMWSHLPVIGVDTCQGCVATYPDDMGDVTTATYMTPAQITTNVIVPGVEVAVTVAYPNGESWGGVLRNSKAPRHGRYPASGGQLWCPACEAPVEECREADEIRRRLAALEGRTDE